MTNERYIKLRNSVIKHAAAYADRVIAELGIKREDPRKCGSLWSVTWNKLLASRMDLLTKEKILEYEIEKLSPVLDNYQDTLKDKKDQLNAVKSALQQEGMNG